MHDLRNHCLNVQNGRFLPSFIRGSFFFRGVNGYLYSFLQGIFARVAPTVARSCRSHFWPKASFHRSLGQRPRPISDTEDLAEGHIHLPGTSITSVMMAFGQRLLFSLFPGALPQATMREAFGQKQAFGYAQTPLAILKHMTWVKNSPSMGQTFDQCPGIYWPKASFSP